MADQPKRARGHCFSPRESQQDRRGILLAKGEKSAASFGWKLAADSLSDRSGPRQPR
jgi:hypothetical protein